MHLYCLVRADSEEAGLERLIKNMEHYECWKEEYRGFLHPVIGDLSTEKFGLSADEQWQELAQTIQVIYHNGALLNFIFPYEFLKETNVHGTVETLRLACAGQPKYYHYVSSYSVYDSAGLHHVGVGDAFGSVEQVLGVGGRHARSLPRTRCRAPRVCLPTLMPTLIDDAGWYVHAHRIPSPNCDDCSQAAKSGNTS